MNIDQANKRLEEINKKKKTGRPKGVKNGQGKSIRSQRLRGITNPINNTNIINDPIILRDVPLFRKQYEFISSPAKETFFVGGVGSGKTLALAWSLFMEASKPHNECILMRKTLKSLKSTTLPILLKGSNPVMPHGSYKLNKADNIIEVNGGGIIYCLGMEHVETIRSINAGGIFLDEAIEFTKEEYHELLMRLRNVNGSRIMRCVSNAADPSHFLYKHFFVERMKNGDAFKSRKVITASSFENSLLPSDYIHDTLGNLDENTHKRMVEGRWIKYSGLVYPSFDRNVHVSELCKDGYEEYYLGIDWGQTHPTAILLIGYTKGIIYVLDELCKSDMGIQTIRNYIKDIKDRYSNITLLYDPSAKILFNDLANVGVYLKKANRDVPVGIGRVRSYFNYNTVHDVGKIGERGIFIDSGCVNLIRELECYQYKDVGKNIGSSGAVKKENDDCLDSLRYVVNEIEDGRGSFIYPSFSGIEELDELKVDPLDGFEEIEMGYDGVDGEGLAGKGYDGGYREY